MTINVIDNSYSFFLLIAHNRKEKALSRACHHWWCFALLIWAFCLLYLLAREKRLLVLIIKMVVDSQSKRIEKIIFY